MSARLDLTFWGSQTKMEGAIRNLDDRGENISLTRYLDIGKELTTSEQLL